jgi:hypothetical protein
VSGEIGNEQLKVGDVPPADANWQTIGRFALSFDGYESSGSFRNCAEIGEKWAQAFLAAGALPDSLTELRTCLFFEQRRWRHYGFDPDEQARSYLGALLEGIREKVRAGEIS